MKKIFFALRAMCVSSQTTFSVWVSFSPAPEQKGLPTENSLFQTPSGNEKKTLFFFYFFLFFFCFFSVFFLFFSISKGNIS